MHSRLYIAFHVQRILASFLEQSLHQIRPDITLDELGADSFDLVELQTIIEETFGIFIAEPVQTYVTVADLVD